MKSSNFRINKPKYLNSLLFFIKECNNQYLGVVKLNKLFYYLDFIYYRDHKTLVTGDKYFCKEFGPVPAKIDQIIAEAKKEELLDIEELFTKRGKRTKFKALKNYDLKVFNEEEKDLLYKIVKQFKSYSTDRIVAQTHLEAPWFYADLYEEIDYNYAKDIELFQCQE